MHSYNGNILCAFLCHPDCKGWIPPEELYVDDNGDKWDICQLCADWERQQVARKNNS